MNTKTRKPWWTRGMQVLKRSLIGLFLMAGTVLVVGMLLWAAGFFHRKVPNDVGQMGLALPATAKRVIVQAVEMPRYETAVGVTQAIHEASVASKILARVIEVNVNAGQVVRSGDILVRLQDEDLDSRVKQLESNASAARARQSQASIEWDRAKVLLPQMAISQSEYSQREADWKAASAELERASQAVEEAKVLKTYATIVAPFDGIVVDKQVKPGDTTVPGQVLFKIYDPTHMQLVAQVRESLALGLRPGQSILASLDALGYECEATISEVVPQADSATHSFAVKVIGPCPPGVYGGMYGRLKFPTGKETLTLIPKEALVRVGQLALVYIAHQDHLERRNVQIGREIQGQFEVLAGLRPGEEVVLMDPRSLLEFSTLELGRSK